MDKFPVRRIPPFLQHGLSLYGSLGTIRSRVGRGDGMLHLFLMTPSFVSTNECDVVAIDDMITYDLFTTYYEANKSYMGLVPLSWDDALKLLESHDGYGIGCYMVGQEDPKIVSERELQAGLGWLAMNKALGYSIGFKPVILDLPLLESIQVSHQNRN